MKKHKGWYLPDNDQEMVKHITKKGYQYHARELSLSFVTEFNLAVDVGACIGLWTRYLGEAFKRVVAFEPSAENLPFLKLNTENLNIEIRKHGLGSRHGIVNLVRDNPTNPTNFQIHTDTMEGEKIEIVRLDDIDLKESINYIKIDVEGYEFDVIQGAKETLLKDRPIITIEQKRLRNNKDRYSAAKLLESLGAKQYGRHNDDIIFGWD